MSERRPADELRIERAKAARHGAIVGATIAEPRCRKGPGDAFLELEGWNRRREQRRLVGGGALRARALLRSRSAIGSGATRSAEDDDDERGNGLDHVHE